jgi:hypothetical protein
VKFTKKKKSKNSDTAGSVPDISAINQEPAEIKPLQVKKKPAAPKEQHRVINSLVGNLSHALEGNAEDIDEMLDVKKQEKTYHDREKRPTKYRFFLILGLVVFWLAIIGLLSVIQTVREIAFDISNQTALKEEFELFLFPVVINDPPEFSGIETLPPSSIISSAIWKIILTGDTSNYERDMGRMTIPENDVEAAVRSIFGSGFEIRHVTIDNITHSFSYSSENKSYTVPENPPFNLSPHVSEVTGNGEIYRVTVEYIMPTPQLMAGIEYEVEPIKTMIYTIDRNSRSKTKTIRSIELIKRDEMLNPF